MKRLISNNVLCRRLNSLIYSRDVAMSFTTIHMNDDAAFVTIPDVHSGDETTRLDVFLLPRARERQNVVRSRDSRLLRTAPCEMPDRSPTRITRFRPPILAPVLDNLPSLQSSLQRILNAGWVILRRIMIEFLLIIIQVILLMADRLPGAV